MHYDCLNKYECFSRSKFPFLLNEIFEIISEIVDNKYIEGEVNYILKRLTDISIIFILIYFNYFVFIYLYVLLLYR